MRLSLFSLTAVLVLGFGAYQLANAQDGSSLDQGIGQFQRENYDEAEAFLKKARQEDPASTRAAYYLGMTEKKLQKYDEAKIHLTDAVTLTPKIKEALLELVEVYYQLGGDLAKAHEWLTVAEHEGIRPAQAAFLKGLISQKEGKSEEAIQAFTDAKNLDMSLAQAADYQIGVEHLKGKSFDEAEKAFHDVVVLDPNSDISVYANEYMKAIERKRQTEKPFQVNLGFFEEYDDNVVLKPGDQTAVQNVGSADDWREVVTVDASYLQKFTDRFSVKFMYDLYLANQHTVDVFDLHSHTWSAAPTYAITPNVSFSCPILYNYTWVDDQDFLGTLTGNPIVNFKITDHQLGQLSVKLQDKEFFQSPVIVDEDRDAFRAAPGAGWFYFFWENKGILSFRYEFDNEDTVGANWDYHGNRFTGSAQIPVWEKLNFTIAGDAYLQDFEHTNSLFRVQRSDEAYTLSTMLSYPILKELELQFRYTYVKHNSNITIYDYDRSIYSTGVVYKF